MKNGVQKYERIRNMRIDRDLTQQEVAAHLHVKQNTYSQYEIGVLNFPVDITSTDYLLGLTDNPIPYERSCQLGSFPV